MFLPGYASVGGMLDGQTLAKSAGVKVGDYIVAINGEGYRRFPPDFKDDELKNVTEGLDMINLDSPTKEGKSSEDKDEDEKEKRELKVCDFV